MALEWNSWSLVEVLVELAEKHGWDPVYCVSYGNEDAFKRRFPAAIYHDTFHARYGRPPAELADLRRNLVDQRTAEALGYATTLALKQMDRMEFMGGFSLRDRFIHFHRLAGYWAAVLDRFQPDVLLMPTAPHAVYDYIAYALARLRGIHTTMFEYVTLDGMLMAIEGFENGIPALMDRHRELRAVEPAGPV